MNFYTVKIINKKEIAENTLLFELEKPRDFQFKAGQYLMLILPQLDEKIEGGNFRPMSIASAPHEENLFIATRKGISPLKKKLGSLLPGDIVKIRGPYGVFTLLDNDDRPVVFLAGGIGITPVRSMLLQAAKEKSAQKFFLFYSNVKLSASAFFEELRNLENPNYRFIAVSTESQGFINLEILKKHLLDTKEPLYYIVGPPAFVEAMKTMLLSAALDRAQIKVEEFKGF